MWVQQSLLVPLPVVVAHKKVPFFAIAIFASSLASANAWTIRDRHSPSWSITPFGALLIVVSLTATKTPPFFSRRQKERSKINLDALDLCGMAAIGDIFNCGGGLSLMSSQGTRRA